MYYLVNFTATDGATDDFILSAPFMATFTVGDTNGDTTNVSVMILNDDFVERLETFELSIGNVTSEAIAGIGNPNSETVNIIDNDSEWNRRVTPIRTRRPGRIFKRY